MRRYLGGFGPARIDDVAAWSGIPKRRVAPVVERMRLRRFRDEDGKELLDLPRAPLPDPETPAPVRFLPTWDATLLVHARGTGILPEQYRPVVFDVKMPPSYPTFLVDGAVAGTWRHESGRIRIEPFRRLPREARRELAEEAERLAAFHVDERVETRRAVRPRVEAMATREKQAVFGPELFSFLQELRANNDREWFAANKHRYEEHVLEPALDFIEAFAPRLEKISQHFRADARPSGGSLFRIYRDTRFSKDKTPYKTNVGIHFRHQRAKDAHAPGYYLHIGPGEVFAGGGIWHPDTHAANRIREAIVAEPDRWRRATRAGTFARRLQLGGDSLKRVPSWADADHPYADDLRRKDFFGSTRLSDADVLAPGFVDEYARICRAAAPLMQFLCDALDVPY